MGQLQLDTATTPASGQRPIRRKPSLDRFQARSTQPVLVGRSTDVQNHTRTLTPLIPGTKVDILSGKLWPWLVAFGFWLALGGIFYFASTTIAQDFHSLSWAPWIHNLSASVVIWGMAASFIFQRRRRGIWFRTNGGKFAIRLPDQTIVEVAALSAPDWRIRPLYTAIQWALGLAIAVWLLYDLHIGHGFWTSPPQAGGILNYLGLEALLQHQKQPEYVVYGWYKDKTQRFRIRT